MKVFVVVVAVIVGLFYTGAIRHTGLFPFLGTLTPAAVGLAPIWIPNLEETMKTFDRHNLPSLKGKVALVTGANRGLGYATARFLAEKGAKVILGCRNMAECDKVAAKSRGLGVAKYVDLSSLASVRSFGEQVVEEFDRLDMLVLNAGIAMIPFSLSEDGIERTFAVNHVANQLLFTVLRPLLESTAKNHGLVTVTTVSSGSHYDSYPWGMSFSLKAINDESKFQSAIAYGQSKLANVLFAQEVADIYRQAKLPIVSTSCHPGMVATEILSHVPADVKAGVNGIPVIGPYMADLVSAAVGGLLEGLKKNFMFTEEDGALTQTWLAAAPPKDANGLYFHQFVQAVTPSPHAAPDSPMRKQLWDFTNEILSKKGLI